MRVWDINPKFLCYNHIREQHDDIHTIYTTLLRLGNVSSTLLEINRWRGHLWSLVKKHNDTANAIGENITPMEMIHDCPNYPALYQPIPDQIKELAQCDDCEAYRIVWK